MADRMLLISWRGTIPGREGRALAVFDEAMGILGRAQQDGRLESFDVTLMEPNGELDGYIQVHGTAEQISALRSNEEFMRNTVDAQLCVDGLRHLEGSTNERVGTLMTMFGEAVAKVPQLA